MIDTEPILILGSLVLSLVFTVLWTRKASKDTREYLEGLQGQLSEGLVTIREELDPIIKTNSRAMGAISNLADDTKMDKALERRIGQDLMSEYEDILNIVRATFPRVAEYVDDHPEAITKLLPRLETLISDPEARKRLNFQGINKSGDLSRIWREE